MYDFGLWAHKLLSAAREAEKMERFTVVRKVKDKLKTSPFQRGADESQKPYFWEAVIEQLRVSGLLIMKSKANEHSKEEIMLEYTAFGEDWLNRNTPQSNLELKAIGLMYAFFTKKGDERKIGQAAIKAFKFKLNDEKLKRFLYEVRNVLAAANDVLPFQVMTDAVIDQMVRYKPCNMDEFKMHRYDEFNVERLQKYAPTLVKAFTKYKVLNRSILLEM